MKLGELQKYMQHKKLDAIIFFSTNDPCYVYFTGSTASGVLVVPAHRKPFVITNPMEIERLKAESRIRRIVLGNGVSEIVQKRIPELKKVGINKNAVTVGMLQKLKRNLNATFTDVGKQCSRLMAEKTQEEITLLGKASRITAQIFTKLLNGFTATTELELVQLVEQKMRDAGVWPAFETIVAAGKSSSMPHHRSTKAKLRGFCIVDMGVVYRNYNSDFSRTIHFGKPTAAEIRVYNTVLAAQEAMIDAIKPGIKACELAGVGIRMLKPYKSHVIHALGHGIGIAVHETPVVSEVVNTRLTPGMVLAIEPGLYFNGKFGVRIEDTVLVTSNGCRVLTRAPRELICFK